MKTLMILCTGLLLAACGSDTSTEQSQSTPPPAAPTETDPYLAWETNHGVGPIKAFELESTVDSSLVNQGLEVFESKCTACHKVDKQFIGPSPRGLLDRRTPAWIMNMVLNPEEMVKQDPIAKKLLIEFNGSPMANQNLSEEEARAVLEYFRTL